jgi:hypothetical protein
MVMKLTEVAMNNECIIGVLLRSQPVLVRGSSVELITENLVGSLARQGTYGWRFVDILKVGYQGLMVCTEIEGEP